MAKDGKSVLYYTPATINYDFGFPNGMVCCYWCQFCRKDAVGREKCTITGEILPYPHTERGKKCPAIVHEERRITPTVRACEACGLIAEGAETHCRFCGTELPLVEEYEEGGEAHGNPGSDTR